MVRIQRDFKTFDLTDALKFALQLSVFHFFGDISDENVVRKELFLVASKQLLIELKSSALFTINFKVSHFFASILKLDWVFNVCNGGIKRSDKVSFDMWLNIHGDSSLSLENLSELL